MNRFFLQKIQILRNSIPDNNEDPMSKLREAMRGRQCEFSIKKVCQSDVLKTIKGLKNSSATGTDYIDTKSLKLVAEIISPVLTHIINLSIESSIFPRCWKWAKVIPLLKSTSADAIQPKSYRPVAYYSRKLRPAEKNYSVTDQESLAVIESLKHFRFMVFGNK